MRSDLGTSYSHPRLAAKGKLLGMHLYRGSRGQVLHLMKLGKLRWQRGRWQTPDADSGIAGDW